MFFSCSGQHLALQTASLVIKIVDQNAICVLSAGFERKGTFCKSQQHLCHWVLLVQKETQHCNSEPKSIVLEMTNVGHDYFNLWVCVLATSLPLPCTICLTVTILTLTVTHHSELHSQRHPHHTCCHRSQELLEVLSTAYTLRPDSMELFLCIVYPAFYEAKLSIRDGRE